MANRGEVRLKTATTTKQCEAAEWLESNYPLAKMRQKNKKARKEKKQRHFGNNSGNNDNLHFITFIFPLRTLDVTVSSICFVFLFAAAVN